MNQVARSTQSSTPRSFMCCHTFPRWHPPFVYRGSGQENESFDVVLLDSMANEGIHGWYRIARVRGNEVDGRDALSVRELMLKRILEG
jgi:hypothetical protein